MKKFETIIIINPARDIPAVIKRYEDLFTKASVVGIPVEVEDEGIKRLSYEVKGYREGHFVVYNWTCPDATSASLMEDIERAIRIDDNVLKYMTVRRHDYDYTGGLEGKEDDKEDEVAAPPTKSEQSSTPDAMDVLLGLDDYHKDDIMTPTPEASEESEQPDDENCVYTLLEDYTWHNEHNCYVKVFSSWDKAMKEYKKLKGNEIESFAEYLDDGKYEQREAIDDSKKTRAIFEIWHPDDVGYASSIELERKKVIE